MIDDIIKVDDLIKKIEKDGYIDCNRDDPYDGDMYDTILSYLKFCKGFFMGQHIGDMFDEIETKEE